MTITLEPATLRQTTTDLGTHTVPDLQPEPDEGLWVSKIAPTGRPEPWQLVQGKPELRRRLTDVAQHGVALLAERASGSIRSAQIARIDANVLIVEIAGASRLYKQVVRDGAPFAPRVPVMLPSLLREDRNGPQPASGWSGEGCHAPAPELALALLWAWCKQGVVLDGWTLTHRPDHQETDTL